jgi:hypothetical protein
MSADHSKPCSACPHLPFTPQAINTEQMSHWKYHLVAHCVDGFIILCVVSFFVSSKSVLSSCLMCCSRGTCAT